MANISSLPFMGYRGTSLRATTLKITSMEPCPLFQSRAAPGLGIAPMEMVTSRPRTPSPTRVGSRNLKIKWLICKPISPHSPSSCKTLRCCNSKSSNTFRNHRIQKKLKLKKEAGFRTFQLYPMKTRTNLSNVRIKNQSSTKCYKTSTFSRKPLSKRPRWFLLNSSILENNRSLKTTPKVIFPFSHYLILDDQSFETQGTSFEIKFNPFAKG